MEELQFGSKALLEAWLSLDLLEAAFLRRREDTVSIKKYSPAGVTGEKRLYYL